MKRRISIFLSFCLMIGTLMIPTSAATSVENDVDCILEMVSREAGSEYAWDCDGGREVDRSRERVWGWSTCIDKYGNNARHYTTARYETFAGTSSDEWSSGRKWGTGQVWAYSPYISYASAAGELRARVYYGR